MSELPAIPTFVDDPCRRQVWEDCKTSAVSRIIALRTPPAIGSQLLLKERTSADHGFCSTLRSRQKYSRLVDQRGPRPDDARQRRRDFRNPRVQRQSAAGAFAQA